MSTSETTASDASLNDLIKKKCPQCRKGHKPRWRQSTSEYVHDFAVPVDGLKGVSSFSTVICGANKLRRFGIGAA